VPIDLGTPAIEVATGLAFIFFLFSIVISSAIEGIAKLLWVRERYLAKGVKLMLGDEVLAEEVTSSPLYKADVTDGGKKHKPAYVSSRNFALALTRILRLKGTTEVNPLAQVRKGAGTCEEHAKEQIEGLLEEAGDDDGPGGLRKFREAVENWFDDGMDRVSGWYRGWTQVWTCVFALVVAVGLNVDTIRIAERLGDNQALRTTVVKQAEQTASKEGESAEEVGVSTEKALDQVKALDLPILWGDSNDHVTRDTVVGWLITFLALSLGAPFWFDALSKIARLKTTGKVPDPAG
jgi:hypothetical protein